MHNLMDDISSLITQGAHANSVQLLEKLTQLTELLKSDSGRQKILEECRDFYIRLEKVVAETLATKEKVDVTTEAFRCLRNSVAFNKENQGLLRETELIPITMTFIGSGAFNEDWKELKPKLSTLLNVMVQFLINSCVNNEANADVLSSSNSNFIPQLLQHKIKGTGFLINTLFNSLPSFAKTFGTAESFQALISEDSDECLLCLEFLGNSPDYLNENFGNLTAEQRFTFLDYLVTSPCKKNVEFFAKEFKNKADTILKSDLDKVELEFREMLLLTGLVSSFSEAEDVYVLQQDASFVQTAIYLFNMAMASTNEVFKPIEKLKFTSDEYANHPAFMFKAHLIRLLGNLAFGNERNQTLIGEKCLIGILDSTRTDLSNPLITQWAVLALRNLLKENPANQNIVRQLNSTGQVYAPVLSELGIDTTKMCGTRDP